MGLFSKLLNSENLEKAAKDVLGGIMNEIDGKKPAQTNAPSAPSAPPAPSYSYSGDSKWDVIPAEENQYNFSGNYVQYFKGIFNSEFPQYTVRYSEDMKTGSSIFTFFSGERKALVVEIMSENCSAKRLRKACAAEGVAYLRFYHNHQGWWNTRSYVVSRTRGALGL